MEVGVSEFPFYVEGVAVGRGSRVQGLVISN